MPKGTRRKTLLGFAREEKRTAKDYSKRGYKAQARDERKHARFFRREANKLKRSIKKVTKRRK